MWRAFFFAVGSMLIILGIECLVAEQFVVAKEARIPGFVAKILDSPSTNSKSGGGFQQNANENGRSPFGPSRFNDDFALQNSANYYGGVPSSQRSDSQFSLAGFGRQQSSIAPLTRPSFGSGSPTNRFENGPQSRVIKPKDWMPWSLLAAGTLVVLYTNSTSKRGYSSD